VRGWIGGGLGINAGGTGLHDFSLQAFNPAPGQELYANRMQLVTIPEPTMLSAVIGVGWLLLRRRGQRA
jgi:hypothetical protein